MNAPISNLPLAPAEHPLRALRRERGLTQEAVAELAGVSQPSVSKIESGEQLYRGTALPRVALALGVPVREILNEEHRALYDALERKGLLTCWLGVAVTR